MKHSALPLDDDATAVAIDGFDVLDLCHRKTVLSLGKLAALLTRLETFGQDDVARQLAKEVVEHFSTTARLHHEDEELHVFPRLLDGGATAARQEIARLQQDHAWLEQDWLELEPQLEAIANGQTWWDLDWLREAVAVFASLSRDHIALEEGLVYPQVRTRLPERERRDMSREMAHRRGASRT